MHNAGVDLDAIAVFVKVVQAGSFSGAARLLDMPNTTVSAKVARLEERLGLTLIRRTTRKLHVTPAGRAYFERCVHALAEIETAEAEVNSNNAEPRGILRISVSGDVAHHLMPPLVARYIATHSNASIELIVTNRVVDLVGEGIDLAIRAATLRDSSLIARRFMTIEAGLWASRAYLGSRGTPVGLEDLRKHACLVFASLPGRTLTLTNGRKNVEFAPHGRVAVDDLETLRELALQDAGIAAIPDFLVRAESRLVRVLPDWRWTAGTLSFVYPGQPFVPVNVRTFIDLALASIKGGLSSL